MPEAVIYPPSITTDRDKLFACYSLVQQTIDEYNRQSAIASSDSKKYAAKFRAYVKEQFDPRIKQVLAERNRLIEEIRWANYTPEEWRQVSALPLKEYDAIHISLFGDKELEKVKPTTATSPLLDELKSIVLDDLSPVNDPTENLTTYTEVDPNSHISKTADRATVASLNRSEDAYLYDDKGVAHFDGDFEHLMQTRFTSYTGFGIFAFWVLSNDIDDLYGLHASGKSFLSCWHTQPPKTQMRECDSGSFYTDDGGISLNVTYYDTIKRDESVGSYGTLYCYICTGNYYGETGSSLVHTLTITLHTSKKDYRYHGAVWTYNDGTPTSFCGGWVQYIDLQESGGGTPVAQMSQPMGAKMIAGKLI